MIGISDLESIKPDELEPYDIRGGERVLLKTANSARCWRTDEFLEEYVYISVEAARYLAEKRARLVGVDYLSVAALDENAAVIHRTLLGSGVWIIEGLDLSQVEPGRYDLVCLPLRMAAGDGAPARALLRPA